VRLAAHVPQLREDPPARSVDRAGHLRPARDLFDIPQPRHPVPAHAERIDRGCLRDDQPAIGALRVVLRHQRGRHIARYGPRTGERSHDNAIGQRDRANAHWLQKREICCAHGLSPPETHVLF
jgi:hypothetical protein